MRASTTGAAASSSAAAAATKAEEGGGAGAAAQGKKAKLPGPEPVWKKDTLRRYVEINGPREGLRLYLREFGVPSATLAYALGLTAYVAEEKELGSKVELYQRYPAMYGTGRAQEIWRGRFGEPEGERAKRPNFSKQAAISTTAAFASAAAAASTASASSPSAAILTREDKEKLMQYEAWRQIHGAITARMVYRDRFDEPTGALARRLGFGKPDVPATTSTASTSASASASAPASFSSAGAGMGASATSSTAAGSASKPSAGTSLASLVSTVASKVAALVSASSSTSGSAAAGAGPSVGASSRPTTASNAWARRSPTIRQTIASYTVTFKNRAPKKDGDEPDYDLTR